MADITRVIEDSITELENSTFMTLRERGAEEMLEVMLDTFQEFRRTAEEFASDQSDASNDALRYRHDKLL